MNTRCHRFLIAVSIFVGFFFGCRAYQTISARLHELDLFHDRLVWLRKWVDRMFGVNHCAQSYYRWWNGAKYVRNPHGR